MCSRILSNGAEIICSCGGCLCITCATKCLFCSQVVCRGCVTSHANCLTPSEKAKIRTVFCCVCNKRFQGKNVSRCCSCGKKTCLQCHENHDCISKSFAHEAKKMFAEKIMVEPMHLLKMDVVDICVICMNDAGAAGRVKEKRPSPPCILKECRGALSRPRGPSMEPE